ncbi:MAG: sugar kinase [Aigarchaeota archaeon]|nr:sugar kinase [Aigarchaeota archaeon]MCS7117442.1 sugar kinase [Candidatus Calditenuaceae archaeon]
MDEDVKVLSNVGGRTLEQVMDTLRASGTDCAPLRDLSELKGSEEILTLVGDDRWVLKTIHELSCPEQPLLIVGTELTRSFLTSVGLEELKEAAEMMASGEFVVEEVTLLKVIADGRPVDFAVNEGALFPAKQAMLMEHSLYVDGELLWRDRSDGVLVSTPMGSSAYSLSAGGALVHHAAKVFQVVSINSIDLTRRPLIIPSSSEVEIAEISCGSEVELIVDGLLRTGVKDSVAFGSFERPLRLVKIRGREPVSRKMEKKVMIAEELLALPPSAKLVKKVLEYEGPLTFEELLNRTALPERTLRYALTALTARGAIRRLRDHNDARKRIYSLKT